MNTGNSYWVTLLSLILSVSLVLPLCAHAQMQQPETHQHHSKSHTTDNKTSECNCGHQLAEVFQKVQNNPLQKFHQPVLALFTADFALFANRRTLSQKFNRSASFDDTGSPLYLLNSVFLN